SEEWTLIAIEEPILQYAATTFNEATANDGSIANQIDITLVNDEFTGDQGENFITQGKVTVRNVPAGLTPSIVKVNDTTLRFSLSGKASAHADADDSNALQVE